MILFPKEGALTIPEFLAESSLDRTSNKKLGMEGKKGGVDDRQGSTAAFSCETSVPFNLIVLDGTWNQGKALRRFLEIELDSCHLPHAKFVKIDASEPSLFAPLRRQVREDGCSTIEAVGYALAELGQEGVFRSWKNSLRAMVDTLKVQGKHKQIYDTYSEEEMRDMSRTLARNRSPF